MNPIRELISFIKDGKTLSQKKKYIKNHHPILYKYLYTTKED